jgi:hypothetical protein
MEASDLSNYLFDRLPGVPLSWPAGPAVRLSVAMLRQLTIVPSVLCLLVREAMVL